jgi:hypothetical protein
MEGRAAAVGGFRRVVTAGGVAGHEGSVLAVCLPLHIFFFGIYRFFFSSPSLSLFVCSDIEKYMQANY